ncbi:MAG TPA: cytochrome c maturation protein CcmE [Ilumatobacteraceae bacterium]|nr:cytochrome c maturation protein CcmE [Ilumatobacteraceae bacterium]
MDLTPRPDTAPAAVAAKPKRTWWALGLLVVVLGVGGVVVTKFLTESIDYYCNVDELGNKAGCSADKRIRVQGEVKEGTKKIQDGITTFVISRNGVDLPVHYDGVPTSEIFQECIDVIVEGQLRGDVFEGNNVEVKHSNEYKSADKAEQQSERDTACLQKP